MLSVVAVIAMASGCADLDLPSWVPFQGPASDTVPGVTPPRERIERLRKLSESAPARSQVERRQISAWLVDSIKNEKDPLIRKEIISTLSKYPSPPGDVILLAALRDPDAFVRIEACKSLGQKTDNATVVEKLSETLRGDADFDVQLAAARALGETGNKAASAALGEALTDPLRPDPAMQYESMIALKKVTGKEYDTVEQWQQYVRGESPKETPSLAELMSHLF